MRPQLFRAMWPVLEPQPLRVHATTARQDLPDLLARRRVRLVGEPRWSIQAGRHHPGCGGAAEVLIADCPVVPLPDDADPYCPPRQALRGRTTTPRQEAS